MPGLLPRIGVQMFTVRDHMGDIDAFTRTLDKLAEIGFGVLQGWVPDYLDPVKCKDMLDERGMIYATVGAGNPAEIDAQSAKHIAEQVKLFGVCHADAPTLPHALRSSEEGFKTFAAQMNAAGRMIFDACGAQIAYHNHALEFVSLGGGRTGMDILFEETDPRYVNYVLDTHWLASGGKNPADVIRAFDGRIKMLHYKDYAIVPDAVKIEDVTKVFAEIGQGNLDWSSIYEASLHVNARYCIIEQDICKGDPFDSLRISFDFMRKLGLSR